ncbi:MAG: nicotinate phosphoribosyltransferase [Woeseiaceae bacterium]|nr:nicotinate phosphoribosyltransferase [Woeseiaceae bacterium]
MTRRYFTGTNAALFTDLYELTMAQAYVAEGMVEPGTFSLFYRKLPDQRNFTLACGVEDVVGFLEEVRFSDEDIDYLRKQELFSRQFLDYLADFRFTGDVCAVPDGTPVFPLEPVVEVTAPLPEAQIMETWIMNQVHVQTVLATKAARIVTAAQGRAVLDFGLRRIHGADAGLKAGRAFHIAGLTGTSNVLAGRVYGLPISGTMAHSYIQAHDDEMEAFRAFVREFPDTVLLVDTYDTLRGVRRVVQLAEELGDDFRVRGIRLDSGDLADLARRSRTLLDDAGLEDVSIFASGGLDEFSIAQLVEDDVPIDGFGVGTAMGVSADAPDLDIAYKLVEYGGKGRMKLSSGKETLPGPKQVFRHYQDGSATHDVLGRRTEDLDGEPLLQPYLSGGQRVRAVVTADEARERAQREIAALPAAIRHIRRAGKPYDVRLSFALAAHRDEVRDVVRSIAER